MVRLAAALSIAVAALFAGAGPERSAPGPPTLAVTTVGGFRVLTHVDPRTLAPLRGYARIGMSAVSALALAPNGTRVAVDVGNEIGILDTTSGRLLRRIANEGFGVVSLYWLGGDGADSFLVAVGDSKFGYEYTSIVDGRGGYTVDTDAEPVATLRRWVVSSNGSPTLELYGRQEGSVSLDPSPGPYQVVADVAHDRLYAVAASGSIARIDLGGRSDRYHRVALSGRDFDAIWAGRGRIALWGADGLGTIDTRDWTTHVLSRAATGAAATPAGLVAWNSNAASGLEIWPAGSSGHLRVLRGKLIRSVQAFGRYAYARCGGRQYSIELRTGHVSGPLSRQATVVVPSVVSLP